MTRTALRAMAQFIQAALLTVKMAAARPHLRQLLITM
jgi:hypothetical protein